MNSTREPNSSPEMSEDTGADGQITSEKPPAPLIRAADVKAKRAAGEHAQEENSEINESGTQSFSRTDKTDDRNNGEDDDAVTYEIKNEENTPVKKNFKSQSTVKARKRAITAAVTIIAVVALLFGGAAAYAGSYDKIYPNISIMGEDFGGLTREEAKIKLNERYGEPVLRNINVKCEDSSILIDPAALGTVFKIDETVDYAYNLGRDESVFSKIAGVIFKSRPAEDVLLVIEMNDKMLEDTVNALVAPYESYFADRYEIGDNEVVFIKGEKGLYVNREDAYAKIKAEISEQEFEPIILTPQLSEPAPLNAEQVFGELTSEAVAASYVREGDGIVVKSGKPRVEIERSEVEKAIKELKDNERVTVACVTEAIGTPEEELRGLLFRDILGSYKTSFSAANSARSSNVRLAAERINGTILLPGETFSYDKTIGSRTVANGFKEANVYTNNKVDVGVGGGICQTSSTLYSAVLYANLEIVSRTSHSLPVSYIPAGQDATIAEGSIDFKFKNNTEYPIRINASAGSSTVTCSISGTNIDNTSVKLENTITNAAEDGSFSVVSNRVVYKNGAEVKRERLSGSHYNAIQPDPTESPEPSDEPEESAAPTDIANPAENEAGAAASE